MAAIYFLRPNKNYQKLSRGNTFYDYDPGILFNSVTHFYPMMSLVVDLGAAVELCQQTSLNHDFILDFGTRKVVTSPNFPSGYLMFTNCSVFFLVEINQRFAIQISEDVAECRQRQYAVTDLYGRELNQISSCTMLDYGNYTQDIYILNEMTNFQLFFKIEIPAGAGLAFKLIVTGMSKPSGI